LSTDKSMLLLWELCHQGRGAAVPEVSAVSGLARYRWQSQHGLGQVELAIPAGDAALAGLVAELATNPKTGVELITLLVSLQEADGIDGGWCGERAAELLCGPRRPGVSPHRERQTPRFALLLRLLAEASWSIDTTATGPRSQQHKPGRRQKKGLRGLHLVDVPLVEVTRGARYSTVRLNPELRECLGQVYADVPVTELLLPQADHCNPEGHGPSRVAKLRLRLGAVFCARWRSRAPQPVTAEELAARWAGLDLGAVRRHKHVQAYLDGTIAHLRDLFERVGTGLASLPQRSGVRVPFRTKLLLVCPSLVPATASRAPRAGPSP